MMYRSVWVWKCVVLKNKLQTSRKQPGSGPGSGIGLQYGSIKINRFRRGHQPDRANGKCMCVVQVERVFEHFVMKKFRMEIVS